MLIDDFLKTYHFSEHHEIIVKNTAGIIFPLIWKINFKKSRIINFLFAVRGLPKKMDTINGFLESGFILLDIKENEEIVMGFLFGITVKEIKRVPPEDFAKFNDRSYIKGVWNFKISPSVNGSILSTETRIFCPSKISKIFFSIYWYCISYFSGLVRMEILKLIKKRPSKKRNFWEKVLRCKTLIIDCS